MIEAQTIASLFFWEVFMARSTSSQSPLYIGELRDTPLGDLWIAVGQHGLVAVEWSASELEFSQYLTRRFKRPVEPNFKMASQAASELREYLQGKRRQFSLPIDWSVLRPFQEQVLKITYAIPYGQTRTYSEIAAQLGNPKAARAVGRAEATNPMPLVVPCHRVIGADHKLHGYGGGDGLPTKEWLLKMEGAVFA
jgi:methylated-DNA-[protein]-cysteine S-methyltransferase